jgi:pimeloyl-ACP methyl ester carboxylesterase
MYATVNGIRMAYRERGRAHDTTLLMIHGFPLDSRMWNAQLRGLSSAVRVIAPDLRGCGTSEVSPGPYSMNLYADDMAGLLDYLGVKQAVVAGLSMGGYIAFALWRRHPGRVRALVLADTRAEPDSPQARANRDAAAARVQEIGPAAYAEEMLPRLLAPVNMENPRVKNRALEIMIAQPAAGLVGALRGMRDRPDSRPTLPAITVPVLALVGENDVLTPPGDAAAMTAAIAGARRVVVPRAGHLSPLENPRSVNTALRRFIEDLQR